MGEEFYLEFISDGLGKVQVDEPSGYNATSFELKQKEKGYARDIFFGGAEIPYEFSYYKNHYIQKLIYYNNTFGFEAKVNFIIKKAGIENIVGEIDFATAITDDYQYFKCKVIQNGSYQIINRRREVKVDLLSDKDIDGNPITPLVPKNMLLLSKPIYQESLWEQSTVFDKRIETKDSRIYTINPCQNLKKFDIEDSLTFFSNESNNFEDFKIITAKDNIKELKLSINNCSGILNTGAFNGGNGYLDFNLVLRWGAITGDGITSLYDTENKIVLLSKHMTDTDADWSFDKSFNVQINELKRGETAYLCYEFFLRQSAITGTFTCNTILNLKSIKASAVSSSYNSVTKTYRLYDVLSQVVKSISGLNIIAPRFEYGGEFYDNRIFSGNFLRNIIDKGFKISLEDIEKSLMEINCDYKITFDGRIFFGNEKDYYQSIECGFFDNTQFSKMNKIANPRFTVNEFWFKYNQYQSLKENEEPNSSDEIHGESRIVFFNKNVENKKEVEVEWIRSAFVIEENRRKALEISEATSSQNDDDIFIIDSVNTENDIVFSEFTNLQHTYIESTKLSLKTNGDVNFELMGIYVGSVFIIQAPDNNSRNYTVYEVNNNEIKLNKTSGADLNPSDNGIRVTPYTYTIHKSDVPFTNYTNQNITAFNINASDSYSNLRYSIGQNIWNYWKEYLATVNNYWKSKPIKNTWYKNNPKCTIVYNGKTIEEGADIITTDVVPLLSPFIYKDIIFKNVEFDEFMELVKELRTKEGYVRGIDNNERVLKVFPISVKWEVLEKSLTIVGEEKFEPFFMTLETAGLFTTINSETRTRYLKWKIEDDKLAIFDINRQRLYNPIYWNTVSVNGAIPITIPQLKEWMRLIGEEIV
jgi:hypothetical protein